MNAPCHGCPDRHVGCHGTCERYKEYSEERQRIRAERQDSYQLYVTNDAKDKAYRKKLNRYKREH